MTHILNASYQRCGGTKENRLDNKCDQPADEQNIPVLRTRNANIKRPTCKPNFLQTALCHKYTVINIAAIETLETHKLKQLESELTCRNTVHRHSRRTLGHIAQSRTPGPATTQAWHKPLLFIFPTEKYFSGQTAKTAVTVVINIK